MIALLCCIVISSPERTISWCKNLKEYEIKIPVDDLETVEQNIEKLGACLIGYVEERDYYIDTRPCINLVANDSVLRIRVSRDLNRDATAYELTFKGPREKHGFAKIRNEISVVVDDAGKLLEIFKMLGFKVLAEIVKRRRIYQYNEYRIYLDDVEGLGKFVEIELVVDGDEISTNVFDELLQIAEVLGAPKNFISKSYLELWIDKQGIRT